MLTGLLYNGPIIKSIPSRYPLSIISFTTSGSLFVSKGNISIKELVLSRLDKEYIMPA